MFQRLNARRPRWIGVFIQRPGAHFVHHEHEVHHYSVSDLPLRDTLFGAFRNPATWQGDAGFATAASKRTGATLAFHDVNATDYGPASLGVKDKQRLATV
jgi:sterol desaturase/sphingolipid hydroxylase (fatty acid hydroxylase superfamily)